MITASYWTDLHGGLGILLFGGMMLACLVGGLVGGLHRERRHRDEEDEDR